jgi:uncharacterized protein YdhG (YjbR/CyaY superfamily)
VSKPASVDDYLDRQPEAVRVLLEQVRRAIAEALPEATETISYQMPAYRTLAGYAIYFAAWKDHYSVYPASDAVIAALAEASEPHQLSKRTIKFAFDKPVPTGLIGRVAQIRAQDLAEHAAAKARAKRA